MAQTERSVLADVPETIGEFPRRSLEPSPPIHINRDTRKTPIRRAQRVSGRFVGIFGKESCTNSGERAAAF